MRITAGLLALTACLLTVSAAPNETESSQVIQEIIANAEHAVAHSAGMSAADVRPLTGGAVSNGGHVESLSARHHHRKVAKRCRSAKSDSSDEDEDDKKKKSKKSDSKKKDSKVKTSSASKGKNELASKQSSVAGTGNYKRVETNRGSTFWSGNNWDFWSYSDPTHGQVAYQSEQGAREKGLIGLTKNKEAAFLRVSNKDSNGGPRPSVRFQSKRAFDSGLVIFDVAKMPVGCATWPALWTTQGANWPHGGEIDVMEGVGYTAGGKNANQMTVHLGENSPLSLNRRSEKRAAYTGRIMQGATNCNQWGQHTGCAFFDANKNGASWGPEFNDNGGGIWAMQFGHGGGVKIWFWGRKSDKLPEELSQPTVSPQRLDPSSWGAPVANFQSGVIDSKVKKQNIIINITVGGDWAGSVPLDGRCKGQSVWEAIKKGSNYDDAEFVLNGVDVYCVNGKC